MAEIESTYVAYSEPLLVWTNTSFLEQGATQDFYCDLEYGVTDDFDNTFSIQLDEDILLHRNDAVFVDGTQWGGLVYRRITSTEVSVFQWEGRTWHGVWADKIIEPASGQDYYYANGSVSSCVSALISKLSLSALFDVGECPNVSVSNYKYHRYVNGYIGLCEMLASVDLRPEFRVKLTGGTLVVLVDVFEIETLDEVADGELAVIEMTAEFLPPNHVIGLGKGELHERNVVHYYANTSGVVSTTQTLFGIEERVIKYDNPSAEDDNLREGAIDLLTDEQTSGVVEVELDDGTYANIGDYIIGYDQRIDSSVTVPVVGQVVKIQNGLMTINCKAGGVL
jgi:hypothetical protein